MNSIDTNYSWQKSATAATTVAATKATAAKAEEAVKETTTATANTDKVEITGKKEESVTYSVPKKLSGDQVRAIREQLAAQQAQLLNAMAGNTTNQANSFLKAMGLDNSKSNSASSFISNGKVFDTSLPALATTQEGALAAISEGGAYSVDAVASRIFDMASSIAGDDPEMLTKMRGAVEKGFSAAGVDFKRATNQKLPDISNKTYDEVMKRFDDRMEELTGKTTTKE